MEARNSPSMNKHLTLLDRTKRLAFIGLVSVIATCSAISVKDNISEQCFLNEATQPVTKICQVFSLSDWERLGLEAIDRSSDHVLNAITREVISDEVSANFYITFVREPSKELPLAILDNEGWILDALIRSSANKASCSYIRDTEALLKEFGGNNQATPEDERQGKRCGNISIIHSLVRLGVLTQNQAYSGEYLNPEIVRRIDGFHGDEPGMTSDQQRRAYSDFNSTNREIRCNAIMGGKASDKGTFEMAARQLRGFMRLDNPKYDCSIALWANKRPNGSFGFKHVEHVSGVRDDPGGEYLIDTLDGLLQGEGVSKIPKSPATNTWRVGPKGSDWVQLKDSSSKQNKKLYSGMPIDQIEIRCCNLVDVSGQ